MSKKFTYRKGSGIEVGGQVLRFASAVIATGARAAAPPIPGLKDVPFLTNETLFSLTELPKRFGIIGAGPIGGEMAQSFARFGSEVFLVEALHGTLPREDRDAADIVRAAIIRDGVKLFCCGKDLKVSKAVLPLLHRMEERAGERRSLDGTAPLPGPLPTRSSRGEGNKSEGVRLQIESHGKGYDVEVDQLLVAVGRAPNIEGLGLETVGVEFD